MCKSLMWGSQSTERCMHTSLVCMTSVYQFLNVTWCVSVGEKWLPKWASEMVSMPGVQWETHKHSDRGVVLESRLWLNRKTYERLWQKRAAADSLPGTAGIALQQSHNGWVALCSLYKLFEWQLAWGRTKGQRLKITSKESAFAWLALVS